MIDALIAHSVRIKGTSVVNDYLLTNYEMNGSEMKISFPIVSIDIINIRIQIKDQ